VEGAFREARPSLIGTFLYLGNDPQACFATGEDGKSVLVMMKADEPLGRSEREAELPIGNESSSGMSTPQKVEADFPEPELPDEEAWEKERKTPRWHEFKTP
jgi:hypothetical protein